ncbi:MAG: phosphoserine phosphatase SerB [Actinomycetales bacterium]|nr:phosphoserine phosphatase SerB [Actinomycetales bacterium]
MSTSTDSELYTGLILLSGADKPGITASLFEVLSAFAITIVDIEQVVIKDRLILTVLISLHPSHEKAICDDLESCAKSLGVDIATLFSLEHKSSTSSISNLVHVVILSNKMHPRAISKLAAGIVQQGANIERITRLASTPITAIEFVISGASQEVLSHTLSPIAALNNVDIAVQPGGPQRHARKLVVLDVDSTLIQQEVIELLAAKAGVDDEVIAITDRAMRGELDFEKSLRARAALLKGLSVSAIAEVQKEIVLTSGARTLIATLHTLGHSVAVVSGGFIEVIAPLLEELNIKYYKANSLGIENGVLTGEVVGPVIDRAAKAAALREFAAMQSISMEQTIAIGDGANDLDMIAAAGLGIAFNAKPAVKAAADSSLSQPYLDSVLYLLGISVEEIDSPGN